MSFRSILEDHDVPTSEHDQAIKNIRSGCLKGLPIALVGLFAPIVMAFVLLFRFVKWGDNHLPDWCWWFDNNISINGDGWGTICEDGRHLNYVDDEIIGKGQGYAVRYGDINYKGDCYYAKGHHPRSAWARYIWLGWRNRASALGMYHGGRFRKEDPIRIWGNPSPTRANPGIMIMNRGDLWQIKETRIVFFGLLALGRNYGYKVNNTESEPDSPAMCIYIPFSFKIAKK